MHSVRSEADSLLFGAGRCIICTIEEHNRLLAGDAADLSGAGREFVANGKSHRRGGRARGDGGDAHSISTGRQRKSSNQEAEHLFVGRWEV